MTTYVLDIETNAIDATTIWCVVLKKLNEPEFVTATSSRDLSFLTSDDVFITHNGVEFDIPVLNRVWKTRIKVAQVYDTYVLSRLFNPNREGGHALRSWGKRLAFEKMDFDNYGTYSKDMLEYCKRDVELTEKVYNYLTLQGSNFSNKSIRLEHKIAHIIHKQSKYGFYLNIEKAEDLWAETL